MQKLSTAIRNNIWVITASVGILFCYYLVFGQYFPNAQGGYGHDYEQQLPNLLVGYFWFVQNGVFSIPWFSPAQCSGVPFYADPGHGLWALPQFLTLFVAPTLSITITFFVFALLGYIGFYRLLYARFGTQKSYAVLGATLFLFNGFYAYRMIIGHPFHAYMFLPWLAVLLLPPREVGVSSWGARSIRNVVLAGAVVAYMFHSAMIHLLPPVLLAVGIIAAIHAYRFGGGKAILVKFGVALFLALGLIASKLVAAVSFLRYFPRDEYLLPGYRSVFDAMVVALHALFGRPPVEISASLFTNLQWSVGQHELEFGITPVPLALMLLGLGAWIFLLVQDRTWRMPSVRTILYGVGITLGLSLPIFLNVYEPSWNHFLKSIPFVKSSSLLVRWFAAYIPIAILLGVLALASFGRAKRYAALVAGVLVAVVIGYQAFQDTSYYKTESYSGVWIDQAYWRVRDGGETPLIAGVGLYDSMMQINPRPGQNDMLVTGAS